MSSEKKDAALISSKDKKDIDFMPVTIKICCAALIFCLVAPCFFIVPAGCQLLLNSICVTALGGLFSVGLCGETVSNSDKKSDGDNRICKRYDIGTENEQSETIDTSEAMTFPIYASISLFGLYILINIVAKNIISGLLNCHITSICTYSIGSYLTQLCDEKKWFKNRIYKTINYKINYFVGTYDLNADISDNSIFGFGMAFFVNAYYLYSGNWMCNNIIGIS